MLCLFQLHKFKIYKLFKNLPKCTYYSKFTFTVVLKKKTWYNPEDMVYTGVEKVSSIQVYFETT